MPAQTIFADIATCRNQEDAFAMTFMPSSGVDLTGSVVTCNVLSGASATTALLTPTVETEMVGANLKATFSWTQEQSSKLPSRGAKFTETTSFPIEVDLALSDDPTHSVMRFVSNLVVSPGGNVLGA
jgi:hypothetical protein